MRISSKSSTNVSSSLIHYSFLHFLHFIHYKNACRTTCYCYNLLFFRVNSIFCSLNRLNTTPSPYSCVCCHLIAKTLKNTLGDSFNMTLHCLLKWLHLSGSDAKGYEKFKRCCDLVNNAFVYTNLITLFCSSNVFRSSVWW